LWLLQASEPWTSAAERRIELNHNLILLNDGVTDGAMVRRLAQFLAKKLGLPVVVQANFVDLSAAARPRRRQFDYGVLLAAVHRCVQGSQGRVVLLTAKDTFGEGLNWSTGVSYWNGTTAVVSVCRLNPTFWDGEADQQLWERRVRKILLHELGHTFGRLEHCPHWNCCLHGSNSIADIDRTGADYCADCAQLVKKALAGIRNKSKGNDHGLYIQEPLSF